MAGKISILLTSALISAASIFNKPLNGIGNTWTVSDEIKKAGYPVEFHSVTTEDGYILGVHRIPYSPKSPDHRDKPVVFLKHGILTSSAAWIALGPDKAFAYMLADLGYDVWMGNDRGNTYSRNHTTLNPDKDKEFWNFSFHEQGFYDLPATIDYILRVTGQQKLFYVGFSQGTTEFYVMASERPEYNDKIRAMFSFASVVTMTDAESPIIRLAKALDLTPQQAEDLIGFREIFPLTPLYLKFANKFCLHGRVTQVMCETALFMFFGFDWEQMNTTMMFPEMAKHTLAGASSKQGLHTLQGISSGKFCHYDYGWRGNLLRYGTGKPPAYNLRKITAPVSLHYGGNDWLASVKGVDFLYNELARPIGKFLVPFRVFNHLDFLYAKDARTLLYNKVTELMTLY